VETAEKTYGPSILIVGNTVYQTHKPNFNLIIHFFDFKPHQIKINGLKNLQTKKLIK